MKRIAWRSLGALFTLVVAAGAEPKDRVQFNRDVRPILSNNCYNCHGPDKSSREADLRLDIRESALADRNGVPAIVPGVPNESQLLCRIVSEDDGERMPPADSGKRLSSEQVEIIRRWIQDGANWQPHWSFVPPTRVNVPQGADLKSQNKDFERQLSNVEFEIRNPIDAFILVHLINEGVTPSSQADRRTLIRRLNFDLIGLPPSPAEVEAYLADTSPKAYEKIVDRLLASPHYGERMAIYWLDLVRYADTVGYHGDQETTISPYRDYVINSFNNNLPFDQFTIEQLAGDLLPNAKQWQKVASGFNRLNQTTEEGGAQAKEYLAKYAADRVRAVSTVWMGATMGCCECHDHKFDPYATKDFYQMAAFFADLDEQGVYTSLRGRRPPDILVGSEEQIAEFYRCDREHDALQQSAKELGNDPAKGAELEKVKKRMEQLNAERSAAEKHLRRSLVSKSVRPRVMRVLPRGNWLDESGEIVEPGVPYFMEQPTVSGRRLTRLDLAEWLTASNHPQTSRVFMNRLWKLFFGTGISRVLDDIGAQGEWPTHPELLDYLAIEFVDNEWNVKQMVKQLVMSSTYRQSSVTSDFLLQRDPLNRLAARQSQWRIEAETVRDNALAVSGLLVRTIGGPSVRPYQPAGYFAFLNFPQRDYTAGTGENQYRRGLYTHWQRTFLHPQLLAFDAPSREECIAQRPISNTPQAALTLLNDPTFVEAARVFAENILRHGGASDSDRLCWAFRQALARLPSEREIQSLIALYEKHLRHFSGHADDANKLICVGQHPAAHDLAPQEVAAWTSIARVLLNLSESIARE